VLLFFSAGTLRYWEAWVFGAVFLTCDLVMTAYLVVRDPKLLARRLRVGPTAGRRLWCGRDYFVFEDRSDGSPEAGGSS